MAATRIRKRTTHDRGVEFQGVSIADNWRTEWVKKEETAQNQLDKHLESSAPKKSHAKKQDAPADPDGAGEVPGGRDTGPRGGDASEPVPPGGQDTGTRGA